MTNTRTGRRSRLVSLRVKIAAASVDQPSLARSSMYSVIVSFSYVFGLPLPVRKPKI
ncbi:hypothetical protein ACN4EG_25520 [Alkalinema pantanalense CENA528]|uniref:hypothetical protein n=1 Tax=Alkalinema pantanalense TaxID=1620705 RepID=UPI003D6EB99C